jgi:prevent-host-death family protein
MSLSRDIRTVTWLRRNAAALLAQVNEARSPVVIVKNGKPCAVVQDAATYQSMRNALAMTQILSQGEQEFAQGKGIPQKKVFAEARRRIKRRARARRAGWRTLERGLRRFTDDFMTGRNQGSPPEDRKNV